VYRRSLWFADVRFRFRPFSLDFETPCYISSAAKDVPCTSIARKVDKLYAPTKIQRSEHPGVFLQRCARCVYVTMVRNEMFQKRLTPVSKRLIRETAQARQARLGLRWQVRRDTAFASPTDVHKGAGRCILKKRQPCTFVHLCALLCTFMHLHAPLCTIMHHLNAFGGAPCTTMDHAALSSLCSAAGDPKCFP
jgi:hypothetical protein